MILESVQNEVQHIPAYIIRHAAWIGPPVLLLQCCTYMCYTDICVWKLMQYLIKKLSANKLLNEWTRPVSGQTVYDVEAHAKLANDILGLSPNPFKPITAVLVFVFVFLLWFVF